MGRPRGPDTTALTLRVTVETYKKVMAVVAELRETDKRQTITSWIEDAIRARLNLPALMPEPAPQIPILENVTTYDRAAALAAAIPGLHLGIPIHDEGDAAQEWEAESRAHPVEWWLEQLEAIAKMGAQEAKDRFRELTAGIIIPSEEFRRGRKKLAAWLSENVR